MRVVLTNLSNRQFENSRLRLNDSARKFGITEIKSFDFNDIKRTSFYTENSEILDLARGSGYWLWKPYIILNVMQELSDGDILIYSDSGIELIDNPGILLSLCRDNEPVLLFGNGNYTNATFTKRDCFILMDCDREIFWQGPHCDGSFCIFKKNEFSLNFISAWLTYCKDKRILTDIENTLGHKTFLNSLNTGMINLFFLCSRKKIRYPCTDQHHNLETTINLRSTA